MIEKGLHSNLDNSHNLKEHEKKKEERVYIDEYVALA